jgi:hypothetical protein
MAFQVDQDRAEAATTPERKIVDAQKKDHSWGSIGQSHDATENRLASGLYPQPSGQSSTSFTTGGESDTRDVLAEPDGRSGSGFDKVWEPLGKHFARTVRIATGKFPDRQEQLDTTACTGDITQGPAIVAMDR